MVRTLRSASGGASARGARNQGAAAGAAVRAFARRLAGASAAGAKTTNEDASPASNGVSTQHRSWVAGAESGVDVRIVVAVRDTLGVEPCVRCAGIARTGRRRVVGSAVGVSVQPERDDAAAFGRMAATERHEAREEGHRQREQDGEPRRHPVRSLLGE